MVTAREVSRFSFVSGHTEAKAPCMNVGSNPTLTTNTLLQKEDWTDAKYEENTPLR